MVEKFLGTVEFVDLIGAAGHFPSFAELEEAAVIEVGVVQRDSRGAVVRGDSTGVLVGIRGVPSTESGPTGGQVHFAVPVDPHEVLGDRRGSHEVGADDLLPRVVVGDDSGTAVGVENGVQGVGDELLVGLLVGAPRVVGVDLNPDEDVLELLVQTVDRGLDLSSAGGDVVLAVGQAWDEQRIVSFQVGTVVCLDDVLDAGFVDHSHGRVDAAEDHLQFTVRVQASPLGGSHCAGGVDGQSRKRRRD